MGTADDTRRARARMHELVGPGDRMPRLHAMAAVEVETIEELTPAAIEAAASHWRRVAAEWSAGWEENQAAWAMGR